MGSNWWDTEQGVLATRKLLATKTYHELLIHTSFFSSSITIEHGVSHHDWPDITPTSHILINKLFFCPICGDVWLRLAYFPHSSYTLHPPKWEGVASPCQQHEGGIISDHILLDLLPFNFLRHDAELLIRRLHANS